MKLIQRILCKVLLITTLLYITEGQKSGCEEWTPNDLHDICCERCSPGYRVVAHCGKDLHTLCTPCEPNSYTLNPRASFCNRCTQCIDPQVEVKPCSGKADTVCGCIPGFRCGNEQCRYCVEECPKGQEPTNDRTCRKCPEGTFNNKTHSPCKPWRKSCSEGEYIIARGNEFRDIVCSRIPVITPSAPKETTTPKTTERTKTDDNSIYPLIGFFGGSSALMIIFILLLWLTYKRTKSKSKSKDPKPDTPTHGELTIMMVEHEEACSFHQPEQEQGGSSESINTQDSETKLIV
ncbi:tumor necrosis factor receptor superfamily member 9a [Ictalurus punctatus]|uniref:Tumor necrosis factor receptor superfamily member 9a n=1 Tax=Ictalurus punctatus TaxID=7998 RepID=A0A2D0SJE4_ICTPU|nr:tumor necrosis factor receptor superfamily member 9a [Ictalurus punctatus]XP_017342812.1 tumor necrosis factor receptor superfamily member 9a [Ictalurus punctatus]